MAGVAGSSDRVRGLVHALCAYVASYGVHDLSHQRRIAAQLGRLAPHKLSVEQTLQWLDRQVENWAFALLGQCLTAHQVRAAFLSDRRAPDLLLQIPDGSPAFAALATALRQACKPAMPPVRVTPMPIQSLARGRWTPAVGADALHPQSVGR